jgi:acyl-CoA synthetase (NDP forming)
MVPAVRALFSPRSIALIGASANEAKLGNAVMKNLLRGRFELYPVNPHEDEILGRRCYRSVSELPQGIDMAIIALPAEASVDALRDCVAISAKVAVVTSSGFGETGPEGRHIERRLRDLLIGSKTRLLGPNTMGVFVPSRRLDTLFIPVERSRRPSSGPVAFVSQSGAVGVSCLERARRAGLGVSCFLGLGNKVDISENEILEYLRQDRKTRCIAMYLESFKDGSGFCEVAREVSPSKPIVLLKSGRSRGGQKAASSHTGALASNEQVVDGALAQCGVIRSYDEEELVDTAKALELVDSIRGDRICVVASAGGYGVIAADLIESTVHGAGMRMAELSEDTIWTLRATVPEFSSVSNPVDLTAAVTDEMYENVLRTLLEDDGVDAILMSMELQPPNVTQRLVEVAVEAAGSNKKPLVLSVFGGARTDRVSLELQRRRVLAYPTLWRSIRALGSLSLRGRYLRRMK